MNGSLINNKSHFGSQFHKCISIHSSCHPARLTIHILRQQKDWVGRSRKWPFLLMFSTYCIYADKVSGWVRKNPELCWHNICLIPSSFSVLTQYPGLLAVAPLSHQASQACQRSEKSVKTNSTIETTEWGHLPKINYSICSLASRHFSASVKKWVYYAMLSYCFSSTNRWNDVGFLDF